MLQNNNFDLQIIPGSIPPVLHMAQYDSGRQFTATLKNGSASYSVASGATAKIKGFNAAGVAWEQEATISGSTVIFSPSGAATDQFGVMPVTIEITVSEEVITPLLVVFDVQRAGYTNEEAVRSPEFATALEAAVAAAIEAGGIGFTDEFKQALLACFAHVAWIDEHGQDYYDALEAALYPGVTLLSITADYQQDRPIYDTDDLDAIKVSDDLTVTANYSNGTSVVLEDDDYELSGTLTVGTSIITVTYEDKTTTINVVVQGMMLNDILTLDGIQNTRTGHDSSATTWEDLSGNQNDFAAISGSTPSWGTNYAAFDATNRAFSRVADLQGSGSNFTLEFVLVNDGDGSFHPSGTAYQGVVISNCPDWGDVAGRMRFYSYRDATSDGISCRYGTTSLGYTSVWGSVKHIAYVFNGSTCVRYVNGEAAGTVNVSYPAGTKGTTWTIGASASTTQPGYYNGKIFRIGISAAAMTASEIAERFAFFKTRFSIPE